MTQRTCPCGEAFTPTHGSQRYHTDACRLEQQADRQRIEWDDSPRTCAACGEEFTPLMPRQRCCSPTAEERARSKARQPRGRCQRKLMNAQQRGVSVVVGKVGTAYDCDWCGTHCVPGKNVAPHASRFCCAEHKAAWHRLHIEQVGYPDPLGPPRRKDLSAYKRVLKSDPCTYCGEQAGGIDHIDPRHFGGRDDYSNWTASCNRCNSSKQTLPLLQALLWVPQARAYHDLRHALWAAA